MWTGWRYALGYEGASPCVRFSKFKSNCFWKPISPPVPWSSAVSCGSKSVDSGTWHKLYRKDGKADRWPFIHYSLSPLSTARPKQTACWAALMREEWIESRSKRKAWCRLLTLYSTMPKKFASPYCSTTKPSCLMCQSSQTTKQQWWWCSHRRHVAAHGSFLPSFYYAWFPFWEFYISTSHIMEMLWLDKRSTELSGMEQDCGPFCFWWS